jgi:hypothetical protein
LGNLTKKRVALLSSKERGNAKHRAAVRAARRTNLEMHIEMIGVRRSGAGVSILAWNTPGPNLTRPRNSKFQKCVRDSYYEGMAVRLRSRLSWGFCIAGIIAAGILSRAVHTGLPVFDKYLGDALYAAMVYGILRLVWKAAASAVWAMVVMTVIELFQLTMIPAQMLASEHLMTRICARLMGVEFSFLDLLAYGVGIGCIYLIDSSQR